LDVNKSMSFADLMIEVEVVEGKRLL